MKRYTFPAFLVLLASVACLFGMLQTFGRARLAQADSDAARRQAALARLRLATVQHEAAAAKAEGAAADQFLQTWTAELGAESNIEEVFGRLDTLAVDNLLSPSGKSFTLSKNYFFNGRRMPVQVLNLTVAGDYPRTLNWLGAVEDAFPLARVEQISYTSAGNSLALAAQFVFPQKFDSP
jgi:hypothetical protein